MPAVAWWFSKATSRSTWGWRARALATARGPGSDAGEFARVSVALLALAASVLSDLLASASALLLSASLPLAASLSALASVLSDTALAFLAAFFFRFLGFFGGVSGGFGVGLVGFALQLFEHCHEVRFLLWGELCRLFALGGVLGAALGVSGFFGVFGAEVGVYRLGGDVFPGDVEGAPE